MWMTSHTETRLGAAGHDASSGFRRTDGKSDVQEAPGNDFEAGARTYRLAVGLFKSWGPLRHALGSLSGESLPVESLCLIGIETLFEGNDRSGSQGHDEAGGLPDVYAHLFDRVRRVDGHASAMAYAANGAALLDDICRTLCIRDDGRPDYPQWLVDSQCERISSHLSSGGLVLIVSSDSPAQQDASTRTLLRHSQRGVQTHDFTVRPAGTKGSV